MPILGMFEMKGEKFLQLISSMMLLRSKLSQTHCETQLWLMKFLLNVVMVADQTYATYRAKLQELASWNE